MKSMFVILLIGLAIRTNTMKVNKNEFSAVEENLKISLEESSTMPESTDEVWWLNSGGRVFFENNLISTIQGDLPDDDYWRLRYNDSNPTETDNGYHPQNIFRLVTKKEYSAPIQSMFFNINRYVLSDDEHRSASNGVLFFHRYQDGGNLYYAGIRVDGQAVIKKKTNGIYYTMVYENIFTDTIYDRDSNPNLIPTDKSIGLKTEIIDLGSETVSIKLYLDVERTGTWQPVAEAVDDGVSFGGPTITESGFAGIRTDFMDAEFEDYKVEESR